MYKDPTEWRNGFKYWQETGESPWEAGKRKELPKYEGGKPSYKYVLAGKNEEWSRITNDDMSLSFQDLVVRPKDRGGNTTLGNWKRSWSIRPEPGLLIVSPEFDLISGIRGIIGMLPKKATTITAKNAASITDAQWTAALDAAIARGDMTEAQRLRDLHFKTKAPNTRIVDVNGNPLLVYHKTPNEFTVFDNNRSIGKLNWFATPNAYGENGVFATGAGRNPRTMKLYVNMKNPHKPTIDEGIEPAYINEGEDGILGIVDKDMTNYFSASSDAGEGFLMSGGVDNPFALKSAEAITFDNKGVRIPLGKRDNFNIKDIRYGLLPFLGISAGYGLYNRQ